MRKDWDKLPQEIQENGFDFHWDNQKVWSLDIPTEEMSVSELEWMLEFPFWWRDREWNTVAPKEVMSNLDRHPEHRDRIAAADSSFPLDIMQNHKGKWLILDGLHRFVQVVLAGGKTVSVRKISREMIPRIEP